MKAWQNFIDNGLTVRNGMDEIRKTSERSIVFPNGWCASIALVDHDIRSEWANEHPNAKYSVAVCDWDGYFDWEMLRPFGDPHGMIPCDTDEDVCMALTIIQAINPHMYLDYWAVLKKGA